MRTSFSPYLATFSLHIRQSLAQPIRVFANVTTNSIRLFFLFIIFVYVYSQVDTISFPLEAALASVAMYNFLLALSLRKVFDVISTDIKTGSFETSLLRPVSYLLNVGFSKLGTMSVQASMTLLAVVPLYLLFSPSLPSVSLPQILWGFGLCVGGTILAGVMYSLIALPALWINDAEPFYYIVDKSILILGGSYVPVALFPEWLKIISEYSPFGSAMFGTRMFDPAFLSYAPRLFATQLLWILLLAFVVILIYRSALRQVSINGG